ncbi:MAG: hypothetical protein H7Z72_15440, partial [Bacteroidetes bacterium]|nr:hypothetical protein [Fibrella sp.]
ACKQKNSAEEIDLVTQYVGTYDPIQYTATTIISTSAGDELFSRDEARGTLTIEKGTAASDEFFINIKFPGYNEQLTAKLDGTKFTIISKQKEVLVFGMNNLNGDYKGYGEFTSDNKVIYQLTTQANQTGYSLKKVGSFTGPKK